MTTTTLTQPTATLSDLVIAPGQGTLLHVLEDTLRVLVQGNHTANAYEVFELTGVANSGPPPHYHPWSESYFLLEGEVEILIGDQTITATPGVFVNIPGGTIHSYCTKTETARVLVMTSSTAASAFFQELHNLMTSGGFSMEALLEIAARHQVFLGNPDDCA